MLYGTDAAAAVVPSHAARERLRPVLNYSGDAGNLHTYRNEVTVGGHTAEARLLRGFLPLRQRRTRCPMDEYHSVTSAANLGYSIGANTRARFTIRNADSATGLPGAHDFYGISAAAKQRDQESIPV